jgi:P27 family predicted phage terminase small subunit
MSRKPLEWSPSPRFRKTRAVEKPSTATEGMPTVPKYLNVESRQIFRKICKQLSQRKVLSVEDGGIIELYATTWARWRVAMADVEKRGPVVMVISRGKNDEEVLREKKNPYLLVAETCEKAMDGYLQSLGLTPRAREHVRPVKKDEQKQPTIPGTAAWLLEQAELEEGTERAN